MQFKNENYLPMKSFPLFSLEFSWKTPWKKRSYGASRTEKKQDKYRCECVNALTCEWNGQADETHIYIYTHRNFIHGLRTEKAFASITIARREPRGDWNTRIFVELFFFFFFYTARKLKSYTIQNWNASSARGGSNLFPIPRFISDQRGGSPFRGRTFHQLLSFDFYFFFLSPFPFYDNFVVNLKSWTIIALFYFFIESDFCIFENSVRFINLSSRFF